jgi:SAM-dependent methyltransferase
MEIPGMFKEMMDVSGEFHTIDKAKFENFMAEFHPYIENHEQYISIIPLQEGFNGWNFDYPSMEKHLEYYISLKLLDITEKDRYVDIASCYSVFPPYVKNKYKCDVWRQDYFYKNGVNGNYIGGDACAIPVEDNFFDKMTLHCSFEHFEDSKDGDLILEAQRVLKPGGKLCIIPFYCGYEYVEVNKNNFDTGCQFQRYYNPEKFKERVFDKMKNMELTFHNITNLAEIGEGLYCCFSLIFTKKS